MIDSVCDEGKVMRGCDSFCFSLEKHQLNQMKSFIFSLKTHSRLEIEWINCSYLALRKT